MYQIQYNISHGDWIEDVKTCWIDDVDFLEGMLNSLKNSNVTDIKVVKQVDVTNEFII